MMKIGQIGRRMMNIKLKSLKNDLKYGEKLMVDSDVNLGLELWRANESISSTINEIETCMKQ